MNKYFLAFALVAGMGTGLSIGCGGDGGGLSAKSYRNDTCACKTQDCLDKVEKKYEEWKFGQLEKAMKSGKPSEPSEAESKLNSERINCTMDVKMAP